MIVVKFNTDDAASDGNSVFKNCHFEMRKDEEHTLFDFTRKDVGLRVHLDGYAIIPREKYEALMKSWWKQLWKGLTL